MATFLHEWAAFIIAMGAVFVIVIGLVAGVVPGATKDWWHKVKNVW